MGLVALRIPALCAATNCRVSAVRNRRRWRPWRPPPTHCCAIPGGRVTVTRRVVSSRKHDARRPRPGRAAPHAVRRARPQDYCAQHSRASCWAGHREFYVRRPLNAGEAHLELPPLPELPSLLELSPSRPRTTGPTPLPGPDRASALPPPVPPARRRSQGPTALPRFRASAVAPARSGLHNPTRARRRKLPPGLGPDGRLQGRLCRMPRRCLRRIFRPTGEMRPRLSAPGGHDYPLRILGDRCRGVKCLDRLSSEAFSAWRLGGGRPAGA
jgi:hypothetical protein